MTNKRKKSKLFRKVLTMLKWFGKHPILTFALGTIVLCCIAGPHTVGAWYSGAVRQIAAGVVQFFRGAF